MPVAERFLAAAAIIEAVAPALTGGGIFSGTGKTADFETETFRRYLVDTSGGPVEASLHAGAEGDQVMFLDLEETWAAHAFTVTAPDGVSIDTGTQLVANAPAFIWLAFKSGKWTKVLVQAIGD